MVGGLVLVVVVAIGALSGYLGSPPGEYETRQGNILLTDGKDAEAVERFDAALAAQPLHCGAMLGRAIALMQDGRLDAAGPAFDAFIALLEASRTAGDVAERGALAAAYADRGILHDRAGRPEQALADYRRALAIDAETVSGPGWVDKVLYGMPNPATVAKRVAYLEAQLKLPPAERVLTRPAIDARQRMYQP